MDGEEVIDVYIICFDILMGVLFVGILFDYLIVKVFEVVDL